MKVTELIYNAKTGEEQVVKREQTAEEIKQEEIDEKFKRIAELKQNLADTDYKAIKYGEGVISEEEYESIKTQRQAWRDQINQLESEL